MPIDPSLITDTLSRWQTPQFQMPDPLAQYAKLQALKNGMMQQQTDALDLQQKQQQIGGQQALSDAIRKNITPGIPNGTPQINHNGVAASGTRHRAVCVYSLPKYMEGVATQNKVDADAQKLKLENQAVNARSEGVALFCAQCDRSALMGRGDRAQHHGPRGRSR